MDYKTITDNMLAHRLKEGDQAAFSEIFNRYEQLLYFHAYKWLQDKEEVNDVLQDVFIIVWDKRATIHYKENFSGYLYVILRNCIIKHIKVSKRRQEYINSLKSHIDLGENITDHRVRENQLKIIIEKEISALPCRMREVFELSRKEHLSHAEIAIKLGISELTVKTQVKNSLRLLRSRLGLILYFILFF